MPANQLHADLAEATHVCRVHLRHNMGDPITVEASEGVRLESPGVHMLSPRPIKMESSWDRRKNNSVAARLPHDGNQFLLLLELNSHRWVNRRCAARQK